MADEQARDTLVQRVSTFVAENRRAIVVGAAAAVAVGGVGYYLYTHRGPGGPSSAAAKDDVERSGDSPAQTTAAKKKSKGKKRKSPKDKDGPILEERKPKPAAPSVVDQPEAVPASVKELGGFCFAIFIACPYAEESYRTETHACTNICFAGSRASFADSLAASCTNDSCRSAFN